MKCRYLMLLVGLGLAASLLAPSGASAQSASIAPDLGTAGNFGILSGTAVTCTSSDVIGNVGVWPGTAVTQTSCPITGSVEAGTTPAAETAYSNFASAYAEVGSNVTCDHTYPLGASLAGMSFDPGVHCFEGFVAETGGVLTLNGRPDDIWIFKIGTGVNGGYLTGTNFTVTMSGGASPCNVYWWVDAAVTMTDSNFRGTILGGAAITSTRGSFGGNALAKGAVTLTGANLGGCAITTPPGPGNPPTAQHFLVDHFQCYEVKPEDKVKYHKVVLQDQFGKSTVTLKRPWLICAPTVKDPDPKNQVGKFPGDLINPIDHLVCYDLSQGDHGKGDYDKGDYDKGDYDKKGHGGKDKDGIQVSVENQFGKQRLEVKQPQMLCVPSLKTVLSDDDDDGCGDPHHHHGRR